MEKILAVRVQEKVKESGEWWIFIYHQGWRRAKKIGKDKKHALDLAKKIEERLLYNEFGMTTPEIQEGEYLCEPFINKKVIINREKLRKSEKKRRSKESRVERRKYKYRHNLSYNLNCRITNAIGNSLKKGTKNRKHWEDLVGYTVEKLEERLKSTLPEGYTWQDYLNGDLHIDHIIPKTKFNFKYPEHIDFKKCWALSNLQLLTAEENQRKNAKSEVDFQPSFAI